MAFAVCVTITLHPRRRDDFLPLMRENAEASLADEPGCHAFDICTDPDRPDDVFLYEVYDDGDSFQAHKETPHYRRFTDATAHMIAEKRVTTYCRVHR